MRPAKKENLIKLLNEARDIHKQYGDTVVVAEKLEIIKALRGDIKTKQEHIDLVNEWRRGHLRCLSYSSYWYGKKNVSKKQLAKVEKIECRNGDMYWQMKWINCYNWVRYYLLKNLLSKPIL
jgi:hypothetical protein